MCTGQAGKQPEACTGRFVQHPPGQAQDSNPQEVELLRFFCTALPATCHSAACSHPGPV